jgi:hypothetical protein
METMGLGQEGTEKCLGSGQGPNWVVQLLVAVAVVVVVVVAVATEVAVVVVAVAAAVQ